MVRLILMIVMLVAMARPADACTCSVTKQTCEAVARAELVFVGTVKDVLNITTNDLDVTVEVEEVFRGSPPQTVVVSARGLGGSCDYGRYTVGERMLIYANGPSSNLRVSGCSRTAPVKQAAADLAELRRARKVGTGRVSGRIAMADGAPRANIEVRVPGTAFTARTSADGTYSLDLPPGQHLVEPDTDPAFAPRKNSPVDIAAPGICVTRDFTDQWNGHITGRLLDRNGKPIANALVRAYPPMSLVPLVIADGAVWTIGSSARSNAKGEYDLGPLAPGAYRVAVGAPFDPAEPYPATYHPTDVSVPRGGTVSNIDLVLAPLHKMHVIKARVRLDGHVPIHLNLTATLVEITSKRTYRRFRSVDPMTFEFTEVAGALVELKVCANELDCASSKRVRVNKDVVIDLVLTIP